MLIFLIYVVSILSSAKSVLGIWLILCGIASVTVFLFTFFNSKTYLYVSEGDLEVYNRGSDYTSENAKPVYISWIKKTDSIFDSTEFVKRYKEYLKVFKYWIIIPLILYSLAPSERAQYIMLGTYIAQETVQKVENSSLMNKVSSLIEIKIDELLLENRKETKETNK